VGVGGDGGSSRVSFDLDAAAAVNTPAEDAELGGGEAGRRALRRRLRSASFSVLREVQPECELLQKQKPK
jgi:hypothetical protein